jgi:HEXXH motif-containing protein
MKFHHLNASDLAALARGFGGRSALRELNAIQVSRRLLLLKHIGEKWPADRRIWNEAIATLDRTQEQDPRIVREVMGDPLVGAWLIRTTVNLTRSDGPRLEDLSHLSCVAASAAMRAGLDCELPGYVINGRLTLPLYGEMRIDGSPSGPLSVRTSKGNARLVSRDVEIASTGGPGWLPLRRLAGSYRDIVCTVRVEDGNPYRDGYHAPPSERLTASEADEWQALFAEAWALIVRHLPDRAAELTDGLQAVVPLKDMGDGAARSGTARESVGAFGLTKPRSPEDFVITIVHELQHSKLSAVLDLIKLYDGNGSERHFAPWRKDPRPTAGLIQGVYAFLGIADAWNELRAVPELACVAEHQFAETREQVRVGLGGLERSRELTPDGTLFVAGMRARLDELLAEPVSETSPPEGGVNSK